MHFDLVDAVLEHAPDRIVTIKQVSAAEEYLQDHFPGFPVLPGVMMIEAMVQAARRLLELSGTRGGPMVLGGVRALKYGRFVKPGEVLRVEVSISKTLDGGAIEFKGQGTVARSPGASAASNSDSSAGGEGSGGAGGGAAVSGRFTLRPLRLTPAAGDHRG